MSFIKGVLVFLIFSKSVASMPVRTDEDALKIKDASFFSKLLTPCESNSSSTKTVEAVNGSFSMEFIDIARNRADACRRDVHTFLESNTLSDCSRNVTVIDIPDPDNLKNTPHTEGFSLYYKLLLYHTAYAYYVNSQAVKYSNDSCVRPSSDTLLLNSNTVASQLRELLCTLKTISSWHGNAVDFTTAEEEARQMVVYDERTCSGRVLRDCQIMSSTHKVLDSFSTYLSSSNTTSLS